MASYKSEFLHHHYRRRLRPRSHYSLGWLPVWLRIGRADAASPLSTRHARAADAAASSRGRPASSADRRHPAPRAGDLRRGERKRRELRGRCRRRGGSGGRPERPRRALAGHLQRPPHAGRRPCRGARAGGRGLRRSRARAGGLLRPDVDDHGPAGHRPPGAAPHARRAGAGRRGADRGAGALLRRDAARRTCVELLPDDPRAASVAGRVTHARGGPRRGRLRGARGQPSVRGEGRTARRPRRRPSPSRTATSRPCWASPPTAASGSATASPWARSSRAAAAWPATSARSAGTRPSRSTVAELALLPALRAADPETPILADGFSCRTQIEALSGRRARHLAEVLAERL